MKRTLHPATLVVLMLTTCLGIAQTPNRGVEAVLEKYRSALPRASDLAIYQLDWAPTLLAAKERAAREQRPILLIVVSQTEAYTNLYTGHC